MAANQSVLSNTVKLLGEALVTPGTSLLLEGRVGSGMIHSVLGIAAATLLGPLGRIGAILIAANSYSKSITGHNIWEVADGDGRLRSAQDLTQGQT